MERFGIKFIKPEVTKYSLRLQILERNVTSTNTVLETWYLEKRVY
jgi:hypothetical protein